ncbi:hypothetical protein MNB_SV-12-1188 [hydrothermal vent metagenome]|uniref:Uncharacterized protein n=1 Tax=hydrothermal vent metagenome TaxID=652676 RepID=A0A1W1BSK4_9ZZZZ
MKYTVIIIILFILAMFTVLYQTNEHEEGSFVHSVNETKKIYSVLSQKSEQITAKKEIVIEEKMLQVDIGADRNITRDSEITLSSNVKNIENSDACNYFWRENGEVIGVGASIERSFSKGEHIINLQVIDSEGREANDTIKVTAWDYYKIKKMHYSISTGEYTHTEWDIFDHTGKYLIMDDGVFSKYTLVYNDDGKQIEERIEYYTYPEENTKTFYTYDENGNVATTEILDADDIMVSFHTYTYDENGNLISTKSGTDEDNLSEDKIYVYTDPSEDDNLTNKNNNITTYNKNGKMTYSEVDYGYFKETNEYTYDEKDNLVKDVSILISDDTYESSINSYDENGNTINSEKVYKNEDKTLCHYKSKLTYNKKGYLSTKENEVLVGDCSHNMEAQYISYLYDDKGNIIETKSKLSIEDDSSDEYTTLKTIKFYSNELDE